MAQQDYYQILNIHHKANLPAIKSAYRQLALKYHPDHNPNDPDALALFAQIKQAYEVLASPDLRKTYDATYQPPTQAPFQAEPDSPSPTARRSSSKAKVGPTTKGKNLRYNLFISLEEVANGCERSIRYVRNNGEQKETVQLKVCVPKGAFHQQRLKLVQYGDVHKDGVGDLFVIVHIQNHPLFIKKDLDIRVNVPIHYLDVALGSTIEVPTLNGRCKLKLKACEFEDLQYIMKGFGLPEPRGGRRGDLIVYCFMEHPKGLGTNQRQALKKIQRAWPKGEMMRQYEVYLESLKD